MKWKPMLAALAAGLLLALPAYAEDDPGPQQLTSADGIYSTVVQIGGAEDIGGSAESAQNEAPPLGIYPINMTVQQIGEVPYITKVYEIGQDIDAEQLVQGFSQDGFNFSRYDILTEELPGESEKRFASKTLEFEAPSAKKEDLLPLIGHVYDYSEGGFAGQLQIDTNSISFREDGRSSYTYTVSDVREYTGLDRNDAAYIAPTVQKNGVTLELQSVDWQVVGSTPVDGGFVPSCYNAVATYAGTATGSKVRGYIATVLYSGEVEQRMPGMRRVSVIYRGELPAAEPESTAQEPDVEPVPAQSARNDMPLVIGLTAAGILILAGCGAGIYFWRKRRMNDADEEEYIDDFDEEEYEPDDAPDEKPVDLYGAEDTRHDTGTGRTKR